MNKEIKSDNLTVVEPGDKIILCSQELLSQVEVARIQIRLDEFLQGDKTTLIVPRCFDVHVLKQGATVELLNVR